MNEYEASDLDDSWQWDLSNQIGRYIPANRISEIVKETKMGLEGYSNSTQNLLYNWRTSGEVIANYLSKELDNL